MNTTRQVRFSRAPILFAAALTVQLTGGAVAAYAQAVQGVINGRSGATMTLQTPATRNW